MAPPSMTVHERPVRNRSGRASTTIVARPDDKGGAWETIRFGDVTITAQRPTEAEIKRYAEESSRALARALPAFAQPGVRIERKKDVPLFWCDSDNPNILIRELNGKIERGVLAEGQFKARD